MSISSFMICSTFLYYAGVDHYPISVSIKPRGYCTGCCSVNDDEDVKFNLYTRRNIFNPQKLRIGDQGSLGRSHLDLASPTVLYIHGFGEQGTGPSATAIKNAYLSQGDFNIITVDWHGLAAFPWYSHAVANTRFVAVKVAHFLQYLHLGADITLDSVHVIGFSLGAEIAGYVGKSLTLGKLGRITGLDPAFPLYYFQGSQGHLVASDAIFVDVIHTDGAVFGFPTPMGHADFYPNGGIAPQPGCASNVFKWISSNLNLNFNLLPNVVACSHNRAWKFYAESVRNPYGFRAIKCTEVSFTRGLCVSEPSLLSGKDEASIAYMGYAANPRFYGQFYLQTNAREPFAQHPPILDPPRYEEYDSEELEDVMDLL